MNKHITLLCALLCIARSAYGDPDCLDNSWHLAKRNDTKEYHSVACTCPCTKQKILADRGQCLVCRHYRYPRPFIIIQREETAQAQQCNHKPEDQV